MNEFIHRNISENDDPGSQLDPTGKRESGTLVHRVVK